MADTERLAQYETLQENHLGFKGILSGIAEELIPEGFVPDMENLRISTEGIVEAVHLPIYYSPPTGITSGAKSIFTWQTDSGVNRLFAQYERRIFEYISGDANSGGSDTTHWHELRREGTDLTSDIEIGDNHAHVTAGWLFDSFTVTISGIFMTVASGGTTTTWTLSANAAEHHTSGTHVMVEALNSDARAAFIGGMGNDLLVVNHDTQVIMYDGTAVNPEFIAQVPSSGATASHAPKGDYMAIWKNRVFVAGNVTGYATTDHAGDSPAATSEMFGMIYSTIGLGEGNTGLGFDGGWTTQSSIVQFRTSENSQITGLLPIEGALLVFLESAIFSFSGYSNDTFNAIDIYHGANTPKQNAIVRAGGIYYISDDGIYALGDTPQKISKNIDEFLDTASDNNQSCTYWDDRLWFASNGHLVAMKIDSGSWEKYNIANQDLIYGSDHLYLTTTNGRIYNFYDETTSYLAWYLETPVLNQGITTADKRYKSLFVYHRVSADSIVTKVYSDYSETATNVTPDITSVVTGHTWGLTSSHASTSLHWNVDEWSAIKRDIEVVQRYLYIQNGIARTIKIKFNGTGDVGLLGYSIVYKPKRKFGVR
jgi:hypothetical protein